MAEQHAAGRHQGHRFVELADGPHDVQLREMLFRFRPQQQRVAARGQQFVDERVGALRQTGQLGPFQESCGTCGPPLFVVRVTVFVGPVGAALLTPPG